MAKFKITVADTPTSASQTKFEIDGESVGSGGGVVMIYNGRNEVVFMTALDRLIGIERTTGERPA